MYRTPLKNSKNVSKPFKSPFDSPAQNANQSRSCDRKNKVNDRIVDSPLAARNLDAKRVLVLDEEEVKKKLKIVNLNVDQSLVIASKKSKNVDRLEKKLKTVDSSVESPISTSKKLKRVNLLEKKLKTVDPSVESPACKPKKPTKVGPIEKKLNIVDSSADESPVSTLKKITKNDLLVLKKKTFEVRQELESIKSRAMCTKKNDPQELSDSIKRWRTACQSALETLRSEASERNGQSLKVSDVLTMLKIPETLVHYSEKDDSFV